MSKTSSVTQGNILVVDDTPANLRLLSGMLEEQGYRVRPVPNGKLALIAAENDPPDLILLDIMMPEMDGYEVCRRLKANEHLKDIPVIFVTAKEETEGLVQGFNVGGVDYVVKPVEQTELLVRVETHLKISRLTRELLEKNRALEQEIATRKQAEHARDQAEDARQKADERLSLISEQEAARWGIAGFIGKSRTIGRILESIRRLHRTGTMNVLITGESGTGKELIARAIHFGGPRANGPFIPVNCPAVPSDLAESLLFGHVQGAFTGANTDRKGYFELADGGTLFLDEIGDMSLDLQVKLLRVLEDGCVRPVGAPRETHVDVRILAATDADLQPKMAEGTFRRELYYRLAEFTVVSPPLRDRTEDIPLLADHFLGVFAAEMGMERPTLSPEALSVLVSYPFPGNVRELKNAIERALLESGGTTIRPEHLHFVQASGISPSAKDEMSDAYASDARERYHRMTAGGEDFWDVVHHPFLDRALNRSQVQAMIRKGLAETEGSYQALLPLFGISEADYHKFMDFLRHHQLKPAES